MNTIKIGAQGISYAQKLRADPQTTARALSTLDFLRNFKAGTAVAINFDRYVLPQLLADAEYSKSDLVDYILSLNMGGHYAFSFLRDTRTLDIDLYKKVLDHDASLVAAMVLDVEDQSMGPMAIELLWEYLPMTSTSHAIHYPKEIAHFLEDPDYIFVAACNSPAFLYSYGKDLRSDEAFIQKVVENGVPSILEYAHNKLKIKEGFVRQLCKIAPECAQYVGDPLARKAGAENLSDEERGTQVLDYLRAKEEKSLLKKVI